MDKRAIELSVNFLVMLILAIVVFGGGLALTKKIFTTAEHKRAELDKQTESEIEKLLLDGAKVGIPISKKDVRMGDDQMFGLGIYNVKGSTKDFTVRVTFSDAIGEDRKQLDAVKTQFSTVSSYINQNWVFSVWSGKGKVYTIKNNKYETIPILIRAYPNIGPNLYTEKGTYIFNVNVSVDNDGDGDPDQLYDGYIHKIYLKVE